MTKKKPQEKKATSSKEYELNEQQKEFCRQYIASKDFNQTQAAINAGYSAKTAYSIGNRLLKNVEVQKYIDKLKQKRVQRVEISQDDVLKDLIEIKDRCMQAKPVLFMGMQVQDDEGNNLWKFDAKGATKALELIGKHIGFFMEDNKQKQPVVTPVQNNYIMPNECEDAIKHIKDYIKDA